MQTPTRFETTGQHRSDAGSDFVIKALQSLRAKVVQAYAGDGIKDGDDPGGFLDIIDQKLDEVRNRQNE